jgi:hypothetical protein
MKRAGEIPHALYYSVAHADNLGETLHAYIFKKEKNLVLKIFDFTAVAILKWKQKKETNPADMMNFLFKVFKRNKDYFVRKLGDIPIIILDNINLYWAMSSLRDGIESTYHSSKSLVDVQAIKILLATSEGVLSRIVPQATAASRVKVHYFQEVKEADSTSFLRCCLGGKRDLIPNFDENKTYSEIYKNIGGSVLGLIGFCQSRAIK